MKASDVMTTGAATVHPQASLADAARIMVEYRISGLPVVNSDGKLVGMITERDFLRQENRFRPRWVDVLLGEPAAKTAIPLHDRRVEDVMSRAPVAIGLDMPVAEIVELMERHKIKRMPVVNNEKVVGIVSRANLLSALLRTEDRMTRTR